MNARRYIVWSSALIFLVATATLFAASRFLDNGDQTITDAKTGLTWSKDASPTVPHSPGCEKNAVTSDDAEAFVACLNRNRYTGHADWLVPSLQQMASLCNISGETAWLSGPLRKGRSRCCNEADVDLGNWIEEMGFTNVQSDKAYWTATHWSAPGSGSPATAIKAVWAVSLARNKGGVFVDSKPDSFAVWPVRGGK